jgi:hypothetical protein
MMSRVLTIGVMIIVVVSIVYFCYSENAKKRKNTETFALQVEQPYRNSIMQTFNAVLGRDPQEYEVQIYKPYMQSENDTAVVAEKLKGSNEYKQFIKSIGRIDEKPIVAYDSLIAEHFQQDMSLHTTEAKAYNDSIPMETRLQIYKTIVNVFEANLYRLPTLNELEYFTFKLKDIDMAQVEILIQSSPEYAMLMKTQTNTIQQTVVGGLTDAQMNLMILDVFQKVHPGVDIKPDLMSFLKSKLYDYGMNMDKLKALIVLLDTFDNNAITAGTPGIAGTPVATTAATTASTTVATSAATTVATSAATPVATSANIGTTIVGSAGKMDTVGALGFTRDLGAVGTNGAISPGSVGTIISRSDMAMVDDVGSGGANSAVVGVANPGSQISHVSQGIAVTVTTNEQQMQQSQSLLHQNELCKTRYNKSDVLDSLYENIKIFQQPDNDCIYNWNQTSEQNQLADSQNLRNQDLLKYKCANSYISDQLQDNAATPFDVNLDLQKRQTKHGAFLSDAYATTVGSIMPKFLYKEYQ